LLQAGADINLPDRSGLTCTHLAALQGLEDLVDGLIYRNANLFNSKSCDGSMGSPLHCAILKQSWRIVSALLKSKNSQGKPRIDINATDSNGDTALHLATRHFSGDIVRALFFYGVDANIRNKAGLTPL
ncbi:ankyrin repeat-containing domain protein, partial [Halenospora varia]